MTGDAAGAAPAPPAPLDFAYQWTKKEHARARHVIAARRPGPIAGFLMVLGALAVVASNVIAVWYDARNDVTTGLDISLGLTCLVVVLVYLHLWGRGRIDAFRQARTDSSLQHPIHLILGVHGLRVRGKTAEVALRWKAMTWIKETPEFVLFYYGGTQAYYLPKRVATAEQLADLRALIEHHAGDVAELTR
jgi:hypothetical protein